MRYPSDKVTIKTPGGENVVRLQHCDFIKDEQLFLKDGSFFFLNEIPKELKHLEL
jgi:hypothetical protein